MWKHWEQAMHLLLYQAIRTQESETYDAITRACKEAIPVFSWTRWVGGTVWLPGWLEQTVSCAHPLSSRGVTSATCDSAGSVGAGVGGAGFFSNSWRWFWAASDGLNIAKRWNLMILIVAVRFQMESSSLAGTRFLKWTLELEETIG